MSKREFPYIEKQEFTTKHRNIWRVFVAGYGGGRFEVYGGIDESKAQKALDALRRHGIASREQYKKSPVYRDFIINGANPA